MDAILAQLGGGSDIEAILAQLAGPDANAGGGFQSGQNAAKGGGKAKGKGKSTNLDDIQKLKEIPAEQKVWVGGLEGSGITWKQLQEHFNQISRTIYAAVFEKSGTGCVAYKTASEVQQAVMMLNGSAIGNTSLQVDYFSKPDSRPTAGKGKSFGKPSGKSIPIPKGATSPASTNILMQGLVKQMMLKQSAGPAVEPKGKGKGKKGGKASSEINKLKSIDPSLKVWVGGLTSDVTWKQLEDHFKQCGTTTWCSVFPKGTGCVAFGTAEEAQAAIAFLNGSQLGNCILEVDVFTKSSK